MFCELGKSLVRKLKHTQLSTAGNHANYGITNSFPGKGHQKLADEE